MSEMRKDPILNRWIIVAPHRRDRPNEFKRASGNAGYVCPFCEGNEALTPRECWAYRDTGTAADETGWRVRVVPNKYPALASTADIPPQDDALHPAGPAKGVHEIIIDTPRHVVAVSELSHEEVFWSLLACRDRIRYWKAARPEGFTMWFKNVGREAGATMAHLHSQLMLLPVGPAAVEEEIEGSRDYFQQFSQCVFCAMIGRERAERRRVVHEGGGVVAFCPFASRFAFETWIMPEQHASHFEDADDDTLHAAAATLQLVLSRLESRMPNPAYNVILHSTPRGREQLPHYHWHLEILPRAERAAGFEWGSGCSINPVLPCAAAEKLREPAPNEAGRRMMPG